MKKLTIALLLVVSILLGCAAAALASFDEVFAELKEEYPPGSIWDEEKYGGTECYAFAREVLNRLFGSYPGNISGMPHGTISGGFIALRPELNDDSSARAIINALKPGDYVRFAPQLGYLHSGVVLSAEGDSVLFVDANNVATNTVSWESVFDKELLVEGLEGVFMHLSNGPIPNMVSGALGMVTITHDRAVNIRAQSNGRAELVGVAKPGETFVCLGTEPNGWYKILYKADVIAYVSHKLVTLDPDAMQGAVVSDATMQ